MRARDEEGGRDGGCDSARDARAAGDSHAVAGIASRAVVPLELRHAAHACVRGCGAVSKTQRKSLVAEAAKRPPTAHLDAVAGDLVAALHVPLKLCLS